MTNEEIIEEVLFEAHKLGLKNQVFELVHKLTKENPHASKVDLYEKALKIIRNDEKMVYSTE